MNPAERLGLSGLVQRHIRPLSVLKRSGDIVFSLAMLSLGSPVLLSVALLVKLTSPGPVFFVQKRIGRRFQRFGCIKFRTMELDAEEIGH